MKLPPGALIRVASVAHVYPSRGAGVPVLVHGDLGLVIAQKDLGPVKFPEVLLLTSNAIEWVSTYSLVIV